MTEPGLGAVRFLISCLAGVQLGLLYGFLRPLRPRYTVFSDLLFLPALAAAFLYVGFGVCRGDLRLGCFLGLATGGILWDQTAGRLLRPIFAGFWKSMGRILDFLRVPVKKISKKDKKFLCILEKIGYNRMVLPSESAAEDRR